MAKRQPVLENSAEILAIRKVQSREFPQFQQPINPFQIFHERQLSWALHIQDVPSQKRLACIRAFCHYAR